MDETSVERKSTGDADSGGMAVATQQQLMEPPAAKRLRKERKPRKASSVRKSAAVEMDEEIWKKFPDDLFEPVISRLPIPAFFRFRTVSQRWNSMLESGSFSQHCGEMTHAMPLIYTISYENANLGSIYDPSMKKWRHPSIPELPSEVILLPAVSAGGLVCCFDLQNRNTYVCNPLTQAWKEIEPKSIPNWHNIAVGMTVNQDSASKGYKITWMGEEGDFEVYDSLKQSWLSKGRMPGNITLPLSLPNRSHLVSVGSVVHFLRSKPDGIVSYDTASGTWKQLLIPLPGDSIDHFLAENRGKLMLVGLVRQDSVSRVWVWELQKMTLLWQEVCRMPGPWCKAFFSRPVRMTCMGNSRLVMVSLKARQMNRMMIYDMVKREWFRVPGCVIPGRRRRQWMTGGVAFYPCLTARP